MAKKRKVSGPRAGAKKVAKRTPRRQAPVAMSDASTRSVLDGPMKSLVRERFLARLRG